MKKLFIVLIVLCFTVAVAYGEFDNKENTWGQTQTFLKPVKERDSKTGVWKDAPNVGLVDPVGLFYFFDEFLTTSSSATADAEDWLSVHGATLQDDQPGGEIWLDSLVAGDVNNMQLNGESFQITGENKIWYETRFAVDRAATSNWFVGLAVIDQSILAGCTDRVGFEDDDDDGSIDFIVERNNQEYTLDTGFDMSVSTMTRLGFVIDNSATHTGNIMAFVNDNVIAISSTAIPFDEVLTPSFETQIPTGGAFGMLQIDYVKILQER